jgi:hypothetical protein
VIAEQPGTSGSSSPVGRGDAAPAAPVSGRDRVRVLATLVCAIESLALLAFCGFYLWELARGGAQDVGRAVMSALLIGVFAVALAVLARAWARGRGWPNTPTVVWNALLLPVSWSLVQSGRGLLGGLVAAVAVAGIVGAVRARTEPEDSGPHS